MEDDNVYDIILVGDSLDVYMASIYLQTSNYKQLVILHQDEKTNNFSGHDKVPGVLNVKSNKDLLVLLKDQTINLGVEVIYDNVMSIGVDQDKVIKTDKFEVVTNKKSYYAKCLIYNCATLQTPGHFTTYQNIEGIEAIEILGSGCKLSFLVREFFSKNYIKNEVKRQNTLEIKI